MAELTRSPRSRRSWQSWQRALAWGVSSMRPEARATASSNGIPLAIPMARACARRASFIFRDKPLSPLLLRHRPVSFPRKEGKAAKATMAATARARSTHSTGIAPSSQRPRDSRPPATPVSCPPREAYTSSKIGSTFTSSTAMTTSISISITAGYSRALLIRRSSRARPS